MCDLESMSMVTNEKSQKKSCKNAWCKFLKIDIEWLKKCHMEMKIHNTRYIHMTLKVGQKSPMKNLRKYIVIACNIWDIY